MNSSIEWTDETWNPTLGCDRVSPGCDGCYAIRSSRVRSGNPHPDIRAAHAGLTHDTGTRLDWTGTVRTLPSRLDQPLRWRKPRRVFVDSMSDLFHDEVPDGFIWSVFVTMAQAERHTFQVLTKRHGRMRSLLRRWADDGWMARDHRMTWNDLSGFVVDGALPNVWLGVSVEDQKRADLRVPALLDTPAAVRFLSCEPLLGPVDLHRVAYRSFAGDMELDVLARTFSHPCLDEAVPFTYGLASLRGIDWVIVGGESGPGSRPMAAAWARGLREQCSESDVPFFFKQWGDWASSSPPAPATEPAVWVSHADGRTADEDTALAAAGSWTGVHRVGKKVAGRVLDGRTHDDMPAARLGRELDRSVLP